MAKVTIDLAALDRITEAKAVRGVQTAALRGEAILKADLLSRPGTGAVYTHEFRTINGRSVPLTNVPRVGGPHRASAPGEPPAPDSGDLRRKTQADQAVKVTADAVTGRIVANTEYALALERGTERVAARPYLSTLRDEHGDDLRVAFVAGAKA